MAYAIGRFARLRKFAKFRDMPSGFFQERYKFEVVLRGCGFEAILVYL
jgi:hypothetical protein